MGTTVSKQASKASKTVGGVKLVRVSLTTDQASFINTKGFKIAYTQYLLQQAGVSKGTNILWQQLPAILGSKVNVASVNLPTASGSAKLSIVNGQIMFNGSPLLKISNVARSTGLFNTFALVAPVLSAVKPSTVSNKPAFTVLMQYINLQLGL